MFIKSQNSLIPKLLLVLVISFSLQINVFAQGGSNYSLFGIGEINRNHGAFYDGMSGTSISVPSEYAINLKNPAMWSYVENTRIQFGYKFNQHLNESTVNDGVRQSLYQNNGKINDVLTIFSIDTSMGLSLSLGLNSFTSVSYYVANSSSVSKGDLSVTGTTYYQGSGGISNVYIGMSARPADYLSLGASVTGHIGTIKTNSQSRYFEDFTFQTVTLKESAYNGLSTKFGFNLTAIENLSIGGYINLNQSMSSDNITTYVSQFSADTSTSNEVEFDLPTEIGLGIAYRTGKFIIASDFVTQDFTNLNYNKVLNSEFQNSYNFSLGVRRNGNPSRNADYLDRMGYSFGASYAQMYYNLNGQNINEISGSFGINMPIPGTGMIDASFILGQRGTTDFGLINEYFGRLLINLSIGDTWFKPIRKYFD